MTSLALVEDDSTIRELLGKKLRERGFEVGSFSDAESALGDPALRDLYIVDVMLPGAIDGLEFCERLRWKNSNVPILFLSALSSPRDRIEGLRRGADDYLAKPFEMEELLLRVERLLERVRVLSSDQTPNLLYRWEDCSIDFERHEGTRGDLRFNLSAKESRLMRLLIEREGRVVTREEILNRVWGRHLFPSTRTVDNFVLRLRRLFEADPAMPKHLHSVRGMGYKFTR